MTSFFTAATHFFTGTGKCHSWTPLPTTSCAAGGERLKSDPGSRDSTMLRQTTVLDADNSSCSSTANTACSAPSPCNGPVPDIIPQSTCGSPSSASVDATSSPAMTISTNGGHTCYSSDCDHSYCSPPRLLYSPASSSSIALDTPLPPTPFSPALLASSDCLLLSPTGPASKDGPLTLLPMTSASKPGTTLAERRGLKGLAIHSAPVFSPLTSLSVDTPTSAPATTARSRLLSPRTPDSASSFAQRLAGFMRSPTPTPSTASASASASPDTPAEREYFEDAFGRAAPPFFDDAYFFDAAPARPHPDLFDLSVYSSPPSRARGASPKTWAAAKRTETRVFVDASLRLAPLAGSAVAAHTRTGSVSRAEAQLHLRLDRPAPIVPPSSPASTTASSPSAATPPPPATPASPASPALSLSLAPALASPGASPHLRPLLLPQKFARREIADAQASSILQHAAPKLRPLILPQELARRASHPPRRVRPRPRPITFPLALAHRRAFSTGTPIIPPMETSSTTDTHAATPAVGMEGIEDTTSSSEGATRGRREEQRRSQQLDEIITLLNRSGVLADSAEDEAAEQADDEADSPSSSDSEGSTGVITPPPLMSRPGSSSSFSFISRSCAGGEEDVVEKPRPSRDSRNLEDILELLNSPDDGAACQAFPEPSDVEAETEESICAYAM